MSFSGKYKLEKCAHVHIKKVKWAKKHESKKLSISLQFYLFIAYTAWTATVRAEIPA